MANLTDADKVLRNDTGKDIASKLDAIKTAIQNQSTTLNNLSDVSILSVQDGQFLKYDSTEQKWINVSLPDPMVFKGTLGTGGTMTALPVDGSANVGDTYKVIEDGTYSGTAAKVGDLFSCLTKTSSANTWVLIPSGDESFTDTWRGIKVNGTEKLTSSISSGEVDFVEGSNIQITFDTTGNKIIISATDTTYSEATQSTSGLMSASDKTKLDTIPTTADTQPITNGSAVNTKEYIDDKTTFIKSASGSLIHITDGGDNIPLKACEINIEPIQNLHNYDKPWAGGAGKNKLPLVLADIKSANTSGTWSGNVYTINSATFTVNTDNDGNVISIVGKGNGSSQNYISLPLTLKSGSYILTSNMSEEVGSYDTFLLSGGSTIARGNSSYPGQSFTLNSDSGVEWRFRVQNNSNYTCKPMIRLSTETSATFEPYSNICSISGHTESNLVVCGKNLVVASDLRATATHDSVTFTKTDIGRFNVSGTNGNTTYGGYLSYNASILLKAGHTYRISGNWSGLTPSSSTVRVDLRYESTIYLHENTESFTPTEDVVCYLGYRINANYSVPNGTICSPCVTVDNSDTTYEPSGNTYTFTFGQTVYGGSGNALTGEFVSEWGKYTITNDTVLANYSTSAVYGSYARVSQIGTQKIDNTNIMAFCDVTTGISFEQRTATANERRVYIEDTGYVVIRAAASDNITSLEDLKNLFMGANICYTLATPTSLTLSGVTPKTISGINNIFSNCGDTAIEYFTSSADEVAGLIKASVWTEITGTLTAGNTSITLSSGDITSNSTINVFTDGGVDYTSITVTNGSVTLTFDERSSDLSVKVRVS